MKDLHIHMSGGRKDSPKEFKEKCLAAGVDGGAVFSLCPQMIRPEPGEDQRWQARMEQILEFTSGAEGFLPIFIRVFFMMNAAPPGTTVRLNLNV